MAVSVIVDVVDMGDNGRIQVTWTTTWVRCVVNEVGGLALIEEVGEAARR